ncbi:hypothetical protein AALO_G00158720 [Alosa alosa]|uniref:Kinesin-like protein KIF23 n=1 Tax=Alosa alosa TaxID=278164 RepID=A0AAV6GMK8_9TELE|nr:hypothetical protein AALO_G00158720 [Alosa alosa]
MRQSMIEEYNRTANMLKSMLQEMDGSLMNKENYIHQQQGQLGEKDKCIQDQKSEIDRLEKKAKMLEYKIDILQKTTNIYEEDKRTLQHELESREHRLAREQSEKKRMEARMQGMVYDTKLQWEKECERRVNAKQLEMQNKLWVKDEKLKQLKAIVTESRPENPPARPEKPWRPWRGRKDRLRQAFASRPDTHSSYTLPQPCPPHPASYTCDPKVAKAGGTGGPLSPKASGLSVASCITDWEQRVPQDSRQRSQSPPSSRAPDSLDRRRGRQWQLQHQRDWEVPQQPDHVGVEEVAGPRDEKLKQLKAIVTESRPENPPARPEKPQRPSREKEGPPRAGPPVPVFTLPPSLAPPIPPTPTTPKWPRRGARGPLSPKASGLSVASCITDWEQRVPQDSRQRSQSPPSSRAPDSLDRRRGRQWQLQHQRDWEVPQQPDLVGVEEVAGPRTGAPVRPHHRRSHSAGNERWVDHKPVTNVELDTVMQPNLPNSIKVSTPSEKALSKADKYVLTHQEVASDGEIQTKLIKGEVFKTRSGGQAVQFTDIETLKQENPTAPSRKRRSSENQPPQGDGNMQGGWTERTGRTGYDFPTRAMD